MKTAEEEATMKERGAVYGDHVTGNSCLGRAWAAILSQHTGGKIEDIPADIVCLMMAAVKIIRLSNMKGRGHLDSIHDARVYLSMALEASEKLGMTEWTVEVKHDPKT